MPVLLGQLATFGALHPHARKRLVGPDVNFGRELVLSLARRTGGWVGWQPATLRSIAEELAFVPLAESGARVADDVEITALVGQAIEEVAAAGTVGATFAGQASGLGFRAAVRDAVLELRAAGATAAVRGCAPAGSAAADAIIVLVEYERRLAAARLVDAAGLFRVALDHFDAESSCVLGDDLLCVAPGVVEAGLAGALLQRLIDRGAHVLAGDRPGGVAVPARLTERRTDAAGDSVGRAALGWTGAPSTRPAAAALPDEGCVAVSMFRAATPAAELREVLRRASAEGVRWDEVEIVATDPDAYGVELDSLCARLGVRASLLHGVPLERTRIGRALERYFEWIESGLDANTLRQALEAGEIDAPTAANPDDVRAMTLARVLRRLGIGWGRERYEAAWRTLTGAAYPAGGHRPDDETPEAAAERTARRARDARPLAALLRHLLDVTPPVPALGSIVMVRATTAALARAALGWMALVRVRGEAEGRTMARLTGRLERLADGEEPVRGFGSAMAALREGLADLRAWSGVSEQSKPWAADGGALHLTDVMHAGATGRRRTFVVGLDADRTSGAKLQDPVLVDSVRRAACMPALPTTAERAAEGRWTLLRALATLRGGVTLSYSVRGSDGREAGPSPLLLGALRAVRGDATLSYDALARSLGVPACAVPADVAALDGRDAWLAAIADGPLLLDGEAAVRDAFPALAAGLDARALLGGHALTEHHGLVPLAAGAFDPRANPDRPLSPSSLELLAACPRAWFFRHGLGLRAPEDAAYDPDHWLDAMARGSLLHRVFERFVGEYVGRQAGIAEPAAALRMRALVDEEIAHAETHIPPPSRTVFEAEAAELRRAADAFLLMERTVPADGVWQAVETEFGFASKAYFALPDGSRLTVRGRIDRVDRLADGTLRIVDYKTGKAGRYATGPDEAPLKGGRQLQPAVYLLAAGESLGGEISRFEYRFPTPRGENQTVAVNAVDVEAAGRVVTSLLEHVATGAFVPTTNVDDCRYCDFGPVCRTHRGAGRFAPLESPLAEWAAAHAEGLPEYQGMIARGQGTL